jgi:hypothetical protein
MDSPPEVPSGNGNKDSVQFSNLINDDLLIANLLASKSCLSFSSHIHVLRFCFLTCLALFLSSSHIPVFRNQHIVSVPTSPFRIIIGQFCDEEEDLLVRPSCVVDICSLVQLWNLSWSSCGTRLELRRLVFLSLLVLVPLLPYHRTRRSDSIPCERTIFCSCGLCRS